MRAVVQTGYGAPAGVLTVRQVARPVVADDEVLVRVHAASVHADVWHVVRGWPYVLRIMGSGLRRPKPVVPGTDMAGVVDSAGANVTQFRPGDEVFGETIRGIQWRNGGAYAEYVAAPEKALARKPSNVTFEQAAATPTAGLIVLQNLHTKRALPPHPRVLVNGAGGGVGAFALQILKARGAEVTAVDNAAKQDLLRALGADHVFDYTRDDFTARGERYDLIFDIPGGRRVSDIRRALTDDGRYVLIGHDHFGTQGRRWFGSIPTFFGLQVRAAFIPQLRGGAFSTPDKQESMAELARMLEIGQLTPIVARTYALEDVVEAISDLAAGTTAGRIVLTVD